MATGILGSYEADLCTFIACKLFKLPPALIYRASATAATAFCEAACGLAVIY